MSLSKALRLADDRPAQASSTMHVTSRWISETAYLDHPLGLVKLFYCYRMEHLSRDANGPSPDFGPQHSESEEKKRT